MGEASILSAASGERVGTLPLCPPRPSPGVLRWPRAPAPGTSPGPRAPGWLQARAPTQGPRDMRQWISPRVLIKRNELILLSRRQSIPLCEPTVEHALVAREASDLRGSHLGNGKINHSARPPPKSRLAQAQPRRTRLRNLLVCGLCGAGGRGAGRGTERGWIPTDSQPSP